MVYFILSFIPHYCDSVEGITQTRYTLSVVSVHSRRVNSVWKLCLKGGQPFTSLCPVWCLLTLYNCVIHGGFTILVCDLYLLNLNTCQFYQNCVLSARKCYWGHMYITFGFLSLITKVHDDTPIFPLKSQYML